MIWPGCLVNEVEWIYCKKPSYNMHYSIDILKEMVNGYLHLTSGKAMKDVVHKCHKLHSAVGDSVSKLLI